MCSWVALTNTKPLDATSAENRELATTSTGDISQLVSDSPVETATKLVDWHSGEEPLIDSAGNQEGREEDVIDAAIATGLYQPYVADGSDFHPKADLETQIRPVRSARPAKMDFPDSPTQSNGSRSYDRYQGDPDREAMEDPSQGLPEGSEPHRPQQVFMSETTFHEPRSLNDDDTGAVNFDLAGMAGAHIAESPSLDDSGLPRPAWPAPETPAPAKNPFAKGRSQLLPTSQLFKNTQFSSAVRPQLSPTSSRPSPYDFPHNSISPNPILSPTKAGYVADLQFGATSSPQVPPITSPAQPGADGTPAAIRYERRPAGLAALRNAFPKTRLAPHAPMDTYVSMQKSQEQRSASEAHSEPSSDGSLDGDDSIDRRRRARQKKEAAMKQLNSISFGRHPRTEDIEVPSTNTKKASRTRKRTQTPEDSSPSRDVVETSDGLELQEDKVENSQEQPDLPTEHSSPCINPSRRSSRQNSEVPEIEKGISMSSVVKFPRGGTRPKKGHDSTVGGADTDSSNREAIPETSPIGKRLDKFSSLPVKDSSGIPESSIPTTRRASTLTKHSSPRLPDLDNADQTLDLKSSPPVLDAVIPPNQHSEAPTTEPDTPLPVAPSSPSPPARLDSTSTLSALGSTPSISASTTPATPTSAPTAKVPDSACSPAVAKNKRRQELGPFPKLKIPADENLRTSSRLSRHRRSVSTDELARSPSSTPTFEQSLRNPKLPSSRLNRAPTTKGKAAPGNQSHRGATGVFEGTAFAISFQSKKPGETADQHSDRMSHAKDLEARITQAGGRILRSGFDELFEILPVKNAADHHPESAPQLDADIKLAPNAQTLGFTALIADGHSRKVKYMQALALGLPCVASRWVTTCLDRGELVDWTPYLLCAGQSSFLGDAIRSRNLPSYDPSKSSLADVVETRPRLLAGSRILCALKKSEETKKMAYIFLARVLGASLSRVYSLEEARERLRATEDVGRPFDWVYVDEKVVGGKDKLFAEAVATAPPAEGGKGGRKRKRGSTTAAWRPVGPAPKRVRTLSDELVIQSLILGRLIEEGEMEE